MSKRDGQLWLPLSQCQSLLSYGEEVDYELDLNDTILTFCFLSDDILITCDNYEIEARYFIIFVFFLMVDKVAYRIEITRVPLSA